MKVKVSAQQYQNEIIFYPYSYYGSFGQVGYPVIGFQAVSQATQKCEERLGTDNRIFMKPYIRKILKPLKNKEILSYMMKVILSKKHFLLNSIKIFHLME